MHARCPACGEWLQDFHCVDDSSRRPLAGAWAICVHCAEVLRFADSIDARGRGLTLRRTTLAERSSAEAPDALEHALRVVVARLPRR
jgi:hypothetical protein